MYYGHFNEDGWEFVIERPDTPRPWLNILTNGTYCAVVSQTGGGYSFIGGPGYDRITRACPDIAVSDLPGRYIYIRDNGTNEYFNIGWQPVKRQPEWFECRHTPGVTTITSRNLGIKGKITFFVPLDDNLEIWQVTIQNERNEPADLSIFAYIEWVLGNYADDLEDRQAQNLFNQVSFEDNYIVATKRAWRKPDSASVVLREMKPAGGSRFLPETLSSAQSWGKYAFIALTAPVDGFDCDRETFLGRYGELSHPKAVQDGHCSNSDGIGKDAVGVLQTGVILQPGASVTFAVLVGVVMHEGDPSGIVGRYSEPEVIEEKLNNIIKYWDAYFTKLTINTPDDELNLTFNTWNKYQVGISTRMPSIQSLYGRGASSISFRQSCFDLFGTLPMDPELSKQRLGRLFEHQYRDGAVVHQWEPRSDVGSRTGHLDDVIWLVISLAAYLRETGDTDFLNIRIPYYYAQNPTSVYEHMVKALDYCLSQLGTRGLPLLGPGDWNEALDQAGRQGKGESVLAAMMLCRALMDGAEVARLVQDSSRIRTWHTRAKEIRKRINDTGWDGGWYIRAVTDRGEMIGSRTSGSGQIYLNSQSWAVISGAAEGERAIRAMDSIKEHLDTPFSPALLSPVYERIDRDIGTITRLVPGTRQNGGVSPTAVAWAIMAECMLGRGTTAYGIIKKLLKTIHQEDQDIYQAEPYIYPEYISGPDSPNPGRGDLIWSPGAASWLWRTIIDWICGVRPTLQGLRIDPCIPSSWKKLIIIRPFRNAVYRITILNPDGVEKGIRQIIVDSRKPHGNSIIHDFHDGRVHEVEVIMG